MSPSHQARHVSPNCPADTIPPRCRLSTPIVALTIVLNPAASTIDNPIERHLKSRDSAQGVDCKHRLEGVPPSDSQRHKCRRTG